MQTTKHTAWKKNRKFGDVMGGRIRPKLSDNLFNRLHNLAAPTNSDILPIFLVENPSRDFYFPVTIEDVKETIAKLPADHISYLTHILFQKIKKADYLVGNTFQGCFICGSGVNLIILHPFPIDNKMRLGKNKPTKKVLKQYSSYTTNLNQDSEGWYLQWTEDTVKHYFLESLILHEIGHSIDSFYKRFWSKATTQKKENWADNYVTVWGEKVRL